MTVPGTHQATLKKKRVSIASRLASTWHPQRGPAAELPKLGQCAVILSPRKYVSSKEASAARSERKRGHILSSLFRADFDLFRRTTLVISTEIPALFCSDYEQPGQHDRCAFPPAAPQAPASASPA